MPEFDESVMSGLIAERFSDSLADADRAILNLWADATKTEVPECPLGSRARQKLITTIDHTCDWERGQRFSQKPIYPPSLTESKSSIASAKMRLKGVKYAARNVILDLETCWMQVSGKWL